MAQTLADRAWLAYHSLARSKRGKPPSYRSLEMRFALSGGTLSRLMMGDRGEHSYDVRLLIAKALETTVEFLWKGVGDPPRPTGIVPPRLPYLTDEEDTSDHQERPATSLEQARRFLDRAAEAAPNGSAIELLARAQVLAIQSTGTF